MRDRAEVGRLFAQGDRQCYGPLTRSLLAHPRSHKGSQPRHWDRLFALVEAGTEPQPPNVLSRRSVTWIGERGE